MKRLIIHLLFVYSLLISCGQVQEQSYTYTLYEMRNTDGSIDSVVKTIMAINDSCAYVKAYESFSTSEAVYKKLLINDNEVAIFGHKPVSFCIQDSRGNELASINQHDLFDIRYQIFQSVLGFYDSSDISLGIGNNSFSNSSNNDGRSYKGSFSYGDWNDRMNTNEYNESLAREIMLKQAGMEEAAKIERTQRIKYLRGGGYDSKDGGKQVHYKGSAQQQRDLDAIDKYMKEHPDF